jgi:hypothetical protein
MRILIPVLDEALILNESLASLDMAFRRAWAIGSEREKEALGGWEVWICDSGSRDASVELARTFSSGSTRVVMRSRQVGSPTEQLSPGQCLARTLEIPDSGKLFWVIPADCRVDEAAILSVVTWQTTSGLAPFGAFSKRYREAGQGLTRVLLSLYARFLNRVALRGQNQFVWTNAPFFRRIPQVRIPVGGFLEDLMLSDQFRLLKKGFHVPMRGQVQVSARLYCRDGFFKRLFRNSAILIRFRWLGEDAQSLRARYRGLKRSDEPSKLE